MVLRHCLIVCEVGLKALICLQHHLSISETKVLLSLKSNVVIPTFPEIQCCTKCFSSSDQHFGVAYRKSSKGDADTSEMISRHTFSIFESFSHCLHSGIRITNICSRNKEIKVHHFCTELCQRMMPLKKYRQAS